MEVTEDTGDEPVPGTSMDTQPRPAKFARTSSRSSSASSRGGRRATARHVDDALVSMLGTIATSSQRAVDNISTATRAASQERDAIGDFGHYMTTEMRAIPNKRWNRFQLAVMHLIHQYKDANDDEDLPPLFPSVRQQQQQPPPPPPQQLPSTPVRGPTPQVQPPAEYSFPLTSGLPSATTFTRPMPPRRSSDPPPQMSSTPTASFTEDLLQPGGLFRQQQQMQQQLQQPQVQSQPSAALGRPPQFSPSQGSQGAQWQQSPSSQDTSIHTGLTPLLNRSDQNINLSSIISTLNIPPDGDTPSGSQQ